MQPECGVKLDDERDNDLAGSKRTGWNQNKWNTIREFFDTNLGVGVLTILFTLIAGPYIAWTIESAQKQRDREMRNIAERQLQLEGAQELMTSSLEGRLSRSDLLITALAHEMPEEIVSRRFEDYEEAYKASTKGFASFPLLFAEIKEQKFGGEHYFQSALSNYVVASLNRLDKCAVLAFNQRSRSRLGRSAGTTPRISTEYQGTLICGQTAEGLDWDTRSEIDKLARCIGTFNKELIDRIRLVKLAQSSDYWMEIKSTHWDAVSAQLDAGCADLDRANYKPSDRIDAEIPPEE